MKTPEDFDTLEEYDKYFEWMANNNAVQTDDENTSFQTHRNIQLYVEALEFKDSLRLEQLKQEYMKVYNICTVNGTNKYDYKNRYLKRYDAMKKIANELGVNVAKPLRSIKDIKVEITAIFKKYETDSQLLKNKVDDFIGDIKRLPDTKVVDSHLDEIKSIEAELENNWRDD